VKLGRDGTELRNCGSQILKVRNRSSATFLVRNSATELLVRNIAELRRCGLKLRMPTFVDQSLVNIPAQKRNTPLDRGVIHSLLFAVYSEAGRFLFLTLSLLSSYIGYPLPSSSALWVFPACSRWPCSIFTFTPVHFTPHQPLLSNPPFRTLTYNHILQDYQPLQLFLIFIT
jgi:hypothetical protein